MIKNFFSNFIEVKKSKMSPINIQFDDFSSEIPQYHFDILAKLNRTYNFSGKKILDVGGSNIPEKLMQQYGVSKFVCIDPISKWNHFHNASVKNVYNGKKIYKEELLKEALEENYCFILDEDIENLYSSFLHGYFDIIISISTFEHVTSILKTMEILYTLLKSGGILHSQYEPIFSCKAGHHCYVSDDINFNVTKELDFIHLLCSREEAVLKLRKHDFAEETIQQMVAQIYDSQIINRKFINEHLLEIMNSPFNNYTVNYFYIEVCEQALQELFSTKYGNMRFDVRGVSITCVK